MIQILISDWFSDSEQATRPVAFVIRDAAELLALVTRSVTALEHLKKLNSIAVDGTELFTAHVDNEHSSNDFGDSAVFALQPDAQPIEHQLERLQLLHGEREIIVYPSGEFKLRLGAESSEEFIDSQRAAFDASGQHLSIKHGRVKREGVTHQANRRERSPASAEQITEARSELQTNDLEIDDDAEVSQTDGRPCWIQAWCYINA